MQEFTVDSTVTESINMLDGVKGIGESDAIYPPPALPSAVFDAIPRFPAVYLKPPSTPESVWNMLDRHDERYR